MERIKEALDRAKKSPSAPAHPSRAPGEPARHADKEGIVYTRTRSIQPDKLRMHKNRVLTGDGTDGATRAVKMLRTQVMQRMNSNEWNALAITSPGAGQGKSLTAVNLSISLSRELQHTVLLVDLDMQNPSVHKYFDYQPKFGLEDFLLGETELADVMINPGFERLVILPTRQRVASSSELLGSAKMLGLVDELKSRYPSRIIIFDLPPILAVDDALAFAPYVDAVLLVVAEGECKREELERSIELIGKDRLLGTVLNKSDAHVAENY